MGVRRGTLRGVTVDGGLSLVSPLIRSLARQVRDLGESVDAVVGVPRGGLLVGTLLAYELGIRAVDSCSFDYDRPAHGQPPTNVRARCVPTYDWARHLLVVEDSVITFTIGGLARDRLLADGHRVTTAALFVTPASVKPDLWVRESATVPTYQGLLHRLMSSR